jgi:transposase
MPRKPQAGYGHAFQDLDRRRDEFRDLYFRKGLALRPVSVRLGVSFTTLIRWMEARAIPRRNKSQAAYKRSRRFTKADEVVYLRLFRKMTMEEIQAALGYSSKGSVHSVLAYRGLDGNLADIPNEKLIFWKKQLEGRIHGRHDARSKPIPPDQPQAPEAEEENGS